MPLRPYVAIVIAGALVAGAAAAGTAMAAAGAVRDTRSGGGTAAGVSSIHVVGRTEVAAAESFWTRAAMRSAANARAVVRGGPPPGTPQARAFSGVATVGTLFYTAGASRHFCTASVLDSTTGDLILTAAHCVYDGRYSANLVFVPGYADGSEPWGAWPVSDIIVAKGWRTRRDPNWDMAFLRVVPSANTAEPIQKVTGGLRLGFGLGYRQRFTVIGYNNTDSEPVRCTASSFRFAASQMEFYCKDFWYGTSGGPWITGYDPGTGAGTIFGVIGGYQAGGHTSWASYSAVFGRAALGLFLLAERRG